MKFGRTLNYWWKKHLAKLYSLINIILLKKLKKLYEAKIM